MAKEPSQIRAEIERTRRELGETIVALARIDVKAQARDKAQAKVAELKPVVQARAKEKVAELKPVVQARAREKVAELKPVVQARAKDKAADLRGLASERARETLTSTGRSATTAVLSPVRGALSTVSDQPAPAVAGGGAVAGGLLITAVVVRRRRRRRRARKLSRLLGRYGGLPAPDARSTRRSVRRRARR